MNEERAFCEVEKEKEEKRWTYIDFEEPREIRMKII